MPTSRREFLKLLGAAASAGALSPLSAIAIDVDRYVNDRLRIRLSKPPGWRFLSIQDFRRWNDELSDAMEDKELFEQLRELSGEPILQAADLRVADDDVTSSLAVYANPPVHLQGASFVEYVERCVPGVSRHLPAFEMREPPSAHSISGFPAVRFRYTYEIRRTDRPPTTYHANYLFAHTDTAEFCAAFEWPEDMPGAEAALDATMDSVAFW